jgi:hypothetical protein
LPNRFAYVLGSILICGVILADAAGYSSLYANLVFLSLAAALLVYGGVTGNPGLSDWFPTGKTRYRASRGKIWSMAMSIESAERGYWHSREDLARILAEAYAVKQGGPLKPDYDAIVRTREKLMMIAGNDQDVRGIFEPHPSDSPAVSRFRRRKDETYLSALEAAIAMVNEGV